jgi:hypothetical protein
MMTKSQQRDTLRPHGITSPACTKCYFFPECGGFQAERSMATCFEETCCEYNGGDKDACTSVCPHNSEFPEWLSDTKGLSCDPLPNVVQPDIDLPSYVPLIDHRSGRRGPFEWPVVALKTYSTVRVQRGNGTRYVAVANSADALRERFLLGSKTKVLLRGIAKDRSLELWWEHRRRFDAPGQLAALDIHAAIAPNFSHFLGVPRTDNLFNRKRQVICIEEIANAGIPVVPHLSAVMPGDWRFWHRFLEGAPQVEVVAKEFQTGNKSPREGRKAIEELARLRDSLGRDLHIVGVGAAQFVQDIARRFNSLTIVDSRPFAMTMRRYGFDATERMPWGSTLVLNGMSLDALLQRNVARYSAWIETRIHDVRRQAV